MLRKKLLVVGLVVVVSGCATTKQRQPLMTQLQMRVGELERQLDVKDEEINGLKYDIKDMVYEIDRIKAQVKNAPSGSLKSTSVTASRRTRKPIAKKGDIIRVNVKIKTVQQALQNAGYYEGNIDGKIGAQTKDAIVKFQEDNGLKSDGIIGRNTWAGLKTFLE